MSDRFDDRESGSRDPLLKRVFKVGTIECAIFFGIIALIIAILILLLKWKALLIVAMVGLGLFIGGVANKKELFKRMMDRIMPKEQTRLYHKEDFSAGYPSGDAGKPAAGPETPDTDAED